MLGGSGTLSDEIERHAADGVDDLGEALHVDERVVVDVDVERVPDRLRQRHRLGLATRRAVVLHQIRAGGHVREDGVGEVVEPVRVLRSERAAGRELQARQVARDRHQRRAAGGVVDADEDHRVGAQPPPTRSGVAAQQQDVGHRLWVDGLLLLRHVQRRAAVAEDARHHRPRLVGAQRQQQHRHRHRQHHQRGDDSAAGDPGRATEGVRHLGHRQQTGQHDRATDRRSPPSGTVARAPAPRGRRVRRTPTPRARSARRPRS